MGETPCNQKAIHSHDESEGVRVVVPGRIKSMLIWSPSGLILLMSLVLSYSFPPSDEDRKTEKGKSLLYLHEVAAFLPSRRCSLSIHSFIRRARQ